MLIYKRKIRNRQITNNKYVRTQDKSAVTLYFINVFYIATLTTHKLTLRTTEYASKVLFFK